MPHGSPGSNQPPGATAVADREAARQPAATTDSAVASRSTVCIQESPKNATCKIYKSFFCLFVQIQQRCSLSVFMTVSKRDSCLHMTAETALHACCGGRLLCEGVCRYDQCVRDEIW